MTLCKRLSGLLRTITLKHVGSFYNLNCLICLEKETNLHFTNKVCENKNFCVVSMVPEDT